MSITDIGNLNSEENMKSAITDINEYGVSTAELASNLKTNKLKTAKEKTSNYSMTVNNQDQYVERWLLNTASNTVQLTLLSTSDTLDNSEIKMKNTGSAGNNATIALNSNTVDGSGSNITIADGESITLFFDGTEFKQF